MKKYTEERPWGKFEQFCHNEKVTVKIITVKPNSQLSLQYHNKRDEFWKILSGSGKVIIGEKIFDAKMGDTFTIPKKVKHRMITEKGITFLEIATGEVDEEDIVRIEDEYKRDKKIIVVASGYFDPLHLGHVEYLTFAKQLGNKLIVILNNDEQAKLKKGKSFMKLEERKKILEALKCVDEVFVSIDLDPSVCKSLEAIKPDIFAKGGDRFIHEIPESGICEKCGIKIVDGLGDKIQSSSELIKNSSNHEN